MSLCVRIIIWVVGSGFRTMSFHMQHRECMQKRFTIGVNLHSIIKQLLLDDTVDAIAFVPLNFGRCVCVR